MRKRNFEILLDTENGAEKKKVKGFVAKIKTPGELKFGVCEVDGLWRVTELSTGLAVPGSFADTAEWAMEKAQIAIEKVNVEKTYLQGIVIGTKQTLAKFVM